MSKPQPQVKTGDRVFDQHTHQCSRHVSTARPRLGPAHGVMACEYHSPPDRGRERLPSAGIRLQSAESVPGLLPFTGARPGHSLIGAAGQSEPRGYPCDEEDEPQAHDW